MTNYFNLKNEVMCYGCRACEHICPKSAITMAENKEGFIYPLLDKELCVECGICERACPYSKTDGMSSPIAVYAAQHKDKEVLQDSSSGGMFSALAEYALSLGGLVCGSVFDENLRAIHILSDNPTDVMRMRGSKYVQSDLCGVYPEIRTALGEGRTVLFTGTPCQVDGLKRYLGKPYENLLTVDLICHGVPSPKLLFDFLSSRSDKKKITDLKFRDKRRNGWRSAGSVTVNGRVKTISPFNQSYYQLYYLQNNVSRTCCYECKYATSDRVGDLTIGDYWNIRDVLPGVNADGGFSAILVNTENGKRALDAIRHKLVLHETSLSDCVKGNGNLSHPSPKPQSRAYIYEMIADEGYSAVEKKLFKPKKLVPFLRRITPGFVKKLLKKILSK